jgi:hypothetical protein
LTTTLTMMMAAVRRTNKSFKFCTPLLLLVVVGVVVHRYLFHQLLLPRRLPPRMRCQDVVMESKGSSPPLRRRMHPQPIVALRRFIASLLNFVIIPRRPSSTFAKDGQMLHWMICLWRGDVVRHHYRQEGGA